MSTAKCLVLACALVLTGCKGGRPGEAPSAIVLSPAAPLLTAVGAQLRLQASGADGPVSWGSSNPQIVSVDDEGLVTSVAEGKATISAQAEGLVADTVEVRVDTRYAHVTAQVRYQDREYDATGFTGNRPYKPVRFAQAELLDGAGALLQRATSDADGELRFDPVPKGLPYKLRVLASAGASVHNTAGAGYAVAKDFTPQDETPLALDIDSSNGALGAFAILDTLTSGAQFVAEAAGVAVPAFRAYWQPGSAYGTYYCTGRSSDCPAGAGIYVGHDVSSGDSDEFDDDVIWHEFGHLLTRSFSRDDTPGGCHLFSANDLDLRLAWSEGWGDFFPIAVKEWLAGAHPEWLSLAAGASTSLYVDTVGQAAGVAYDLSTLASTPFVYNSNELAIARVLWRVNAAFGFSALWQVLTGYFPGAATPASLDTLWDGWSRLNVFTAAQRAELEDILAERQIAYRADAHEPDDDYAQLADLTAGQQRTLYSPAAGPDVDRVRLSAAAGASYRIATSALHNGADTVLRVVDSSGGVLAENDDYNSNYFRYDKQCGTWRVFNDGTSLASKIEFTAPATADYYIETRPVQDADEAASARYGAYTLTVTPQ